MQYDQKKARQRWQNGVNNAQGHFLEGYIKAACRFYHDHERAEVEKIPEPFRVTKKHLDGTFTGRFTAGGLSALKQIYDHEPNETKCIN